MYQVGPPQYSHQGPASGINPDNTAILGRQQLGIVLLALTLDCIRTTHRQTEKPKNKRAGSPHGARNIHPQIHTSQAMQEAEPVGHEKPAVWKASERPDREAEKMVSHRLCTEAREVVARVDIRSHLFFSLLHKLRSNPASFHKERTGPRDGLCVTHMDRKAALSRARQRSRWCECQTTIHGVGGVPPSGSKQQNWISPKADGAQN